MLSNLSYFRQSILCGHFKNLVMPSLPVDNLNSGCASDHYRHFLPENIFNDRNKLDVIFEPSKYSFSHTMHQLWDYLKFFSLLISGCLIINAWQYIALFIKYDTTNNELSYKFLMFALVLCACVLFYFFLIFALFFYFLNFCN